MNREKTENKNMKLMVILFTIFHVDFMCSMFATEVVQLSEWGGEKRNRNEKKVIFRDGTSHLSLAILIMCFSIFHFLDLCPSFSTLIRAHWFAWGGLPSMSIVWLIENYFSDDFSLKYCNWTKIIKLWADSRVQKIYLWRFFAEMHFHETVELWNKSDSNGNNIIENVYVFPYKNGNDFVVHQIWRKIHLQLLWGIWI